ncbi:MAG: diaminopimelate epimerase [Gammaproteobacteria bacterium]|nr:MAG: diaminopimelate epimerase [Gammaproteobacteria bacterium]
MRLRFTKMQGLGNDFVLLDARVQAIALSPEQVRRLADRRFGIGCDQVLLLEPPTREGADVRYRIFNADGGEVEQCGNGARCVAVYLWQHGYPERPVITAETTRGLIRLHPDPLGARIDMGVPSVDPASLPMTLAGENPFSLEIDGETVRFYAVSMGNPHAVIPVEDVDAAPVAELAPKIQASPAFPQGVNVGFLQVLSPDRFRLRVYERGAGETLACGSGACAAMVAGRLMGALEESATAELRGGELRLSWKGEGEPVWMAGPAETVFKGEIEL